MSSTDMFVPAPEPDPGPAPQTPPPRPMVRSRVRAGLLGLFLGFTGAHHYYLGSSAAGLLLLATSCCGVGMVVGMVEGVMLLVMSDDEFAEKYIHRRPESMEFVFQDRG